MIKQISLLLFGICLYSYLCGQDTLWLRRFNCVTEDDYGSAVTIDESRHSIIAGHSLNLTTIQCDILLIKYTPNGDTIWTRYYDGGEREQAYEFALDQDGNIIVAGASGNDTIELQCLVIKFSPEGNFLWKREYRLRDIDCFTDVAIDRDNGIFLTGYSYTYSGGGDFIGFLCKYDANGNLVWTKFYSWTDWFLSIVISQDGNFFATGTDTFGQMLTVRLNSSGDTVWTRKFSWGRHHSSGGYGVTLDSFGDIIVVGYTTNWSNYDWGIIKYTQSGDTVWTRQFDFTPDDWATDVATDALDNIYVCGNVGVLDTNDYLLMKLTPAGDTIWTRRYDNGYDDKVFGVAVDSDGNPIVTGRSYNGQDYDIVTIKYRGSPGIEECTTIDAKHSTFKIYPTSARSYFTVRTPLTANHSLIKIFDVSGKMIREFVPPSGKSEIKISLKGINPGVYFLQIGKETKKFLVAK